MAKVNAEDLQTLINVNIQGSLMNDSHDANSMSESIDTFLYESELEGSELEGEVWDAVREKMSIYKEAINNRMNAASILFDAITDALKKLQEAMGDYPDLDSSMLETYRKDLENYKTEKAAIDTIINSSSSSADESSTASEDASETANSPADSETGSSSTSPSYDANRYDFLCSEIPRLEDLIVATENFLKVYEEVENDLNDAFEQVKSTCSEFASIQPSAKISFSPPTF